MRNIFKIFAVIIITLTLLTGCSAIDTNTSNNNTYIPVEQPHLYWKDIDVVVTDVNQAHWYTPYKHNYRVDVTVYSEEYGLTKTLTECASGMFSNIRHWNTQKGDIIKVVLYSWVYDSTGEVQRREIHDFAY